MPIRKANAVWQGNLKEGKGKMKLGSGAFEGAYSFASRFADGTGTNPEELIAAAHAGCFSMALSHSLAEQGFKPQSVDTDAKVQLEEVEGGFAITNIELVTNAVVPDIDKDKFLAIANDAKENCPVSKALQGTSIKLSAKLKG